MEQAYLLLCFQLLLLVHRFAASISGKTTLSKAGPTQSGSTICLISFAEATRHCALDFSDKSLAKIWACSHVSFDAVPRQKPSAKNAPARQRYQVSPESLRSADPPS